VAALSVALSNAAENPGARFARWAVPLLIVGTLALYARTATFDFVHFDDDLFVFANEKVKGGLSWEGVVWAFGRPDIDYWRPLSWLSHMLDVSLFGLWPGGHHLVNVFWHTANAVLLFVFLRIALGRSGVAFFVAAMFAWHPLHVESVAWVSERKDVLCGFFWLASLCLYTRYARNGERGAYAGALGCFALGLASKPMIITLPFQLLLLDLWPLNRFKAERGAVWKLIREKLPFFALTLAGGAGVVLAQHSVGVLRGAETYGWGYRFANAAVSYAAYVKDLFWPEGLIFFYSHDPALPWTRIATAALLLLAVSGAAIWQVKRRPMLFSGWFWFLGTLTPVIGILQVGDQARGDRYTYMALTGLLWVIALAGEALAGRSREWRRAVLAAATLALLAAAACSWRQIGYWRDSRTLFTRALAVEPGNIIALNNLAYLNLVEGRDAEAAGLYRRLLEVDPDNDRAHFHLAGIYERSGDPRRASEHWKRFVERVPGDAGGWLSWVRSLAAAGMEMELMNAAVAAALRFPDETELFLKLSEAVAGVTGREGVMDFCRRVIDRAPRVFAAHARLLSELRRAGRRPELVAAADALLSQFPDAREAHYHAGLGYAAAGDEKRALRALQTALELDPAFAVARLELGCLLAWADDPEVSDPARAESIAQGAERALGRALPQTLEIRAALAWKRGDRAAAREHLQSAIALANQMNDRERLAALTDRLKQIESP